MGLNPESFYKIGLSQFTAAYEVYCEKNGVTIKKEEKSNYAEYLDLRDKLEPIVNRNRQKIKENIKKSEGA